MTQYLTSQISMTTANTTRYTALQSDAQNQSVKIVATADVRSKQVDGKLTFLLPGLTDTIHAEATLIRDDASGFVWSGKITNKPGYVSFLKLNGLTSGFIQVGYHFYELMPMGANYQFLVERAAGPAKGCGTSGTSTGPSLPIPPGPDYCTPSGDVYNTCPALIYMLLVITPAAKTYILDHYSSIPDFVTQGQNQINLAFANSDIPNKEVAIKWIEKDLTQQNLSLTNPPDVSTDRFSLPDLLEPERTNNKADVAFLLTNQGYDNARGIVYDFGPDKSKAYGIVEVPYFLSYYTISHELGHLLGCHHNWGVTFGDDNTDICAHAYRWLEDVGPIVPETIYDVDESWMTLVGIDVYTDPILNDVNTNEGHYYIRFSAQANSPILNFSNPDILYDGKKTGVAAIHIADNARQIRNTGCEVADFFESQDLSVFITTSNCAIIPFTYTANIISPASGLPGTGPYTVTWYWNNDGNFNPTLFGGGGTLLGTGQSLTVYQHPNYPYCKAYWVQCKVVAADGTQVTRIYKIDLRPDRCFCQAGTPPGDGHGRSTTAGATNGQSLSIYPNPVANGVITLEDQTLANSAVETSISDLSGRIVLQRQIIFDAQGQTLLRIDPLPDGLYLLQLNGNNGTRYNLKFIIAKN